MPIPILEVPVEHLEISEEIKQFMIQHQITSLDNLLNIKGSELLKMEGFSYRLLQSLLTYLNDHNCLHLFKDK